MGGDEGCDFIEGNSAMLEAVIDGSRLLPKFFATAIEIRIDQDQKEKTTPTLTSSTFSLSLCTLRRV